MGRSWEAEVLRRGHERIAKDAGTYYPHGEPDKKPTLTIVATKGNTVHVLIDQYVYMALAATWMERRSPPPRSTRRSSA